MKTLLAVILVFVTSYSQAATVSEYSVRLYNFMHYCDSHEGRASLTDNVMVCKDGTKIEWSNE